VRRAETAALTGMAEALRLIARALEDNDDKAAAQGIERLRDLRDDLGGLGRMRTASARVARRTLVWRAQKTAAVRVNKNAGHLDLLGSCLTLARAAANARPTERGRLRQGDRRATSVLRRKLVDRWWGAG
jgi:hypothetical protein